MGVLSGIENNFSEITTNDLIRLGFNFREAVVCWNSSEYGKLLADDNPNDDDARNKILEGLHYWQNTAIKHNLTNNICDWPSTIFNAKLRLRYHPPTSTRTTIFNNEEISVAGCLCCHDMTGKLILCRKVYDVNDLQTACQEAINC